MPYAQLEAVLAGVCEARYFVNVLGAARGPVGILTEAGERIVDEQRVFAGDRDSGKERAAGEMKRRLKARIGVDAAGALRPDPDGLGQRDRLPCFFDLLILLYNESRAAAMRKFRSQSRISAREGEIV